MLAKDLGRAVCHPEPRHALCHPEPRRRRRISATPCVILSREDGEGSRPRSVSSWAAKTAKDLRHAVCHPEPRRRRRISATPCVILSRAAPCVILSREDGEGSRPRRVSSWAAKTAKDLRHAVCHPEPRRRRRISATQIVIW